MVHFHNAASDETTKLKPNSGAGSRLITVRWEVVTIVGSGRTSLIREFTICHYPILATSRSRGNDPECQSHPKTPS